MSREDFLLRRAAAKRAAVLAAARARFAADGLEGASVERIAQEAAVSTATVYRYFPSKLALFEAVLKDGLADFEAALAEATDLKPAARLSRLAAAYARLLDDPVSAGILRAVLTAAPATPAVTAAFYESVKSVVAGAFHGAVRDALAAGALAPTNTPDRPGGHLMGMIEHAILWRRMLTGADGPETADDIARGAIDTFWKAFGVGND